MNKKDKNSCPHGTYVLFLFTCIGLLGLIYQSTTDWMAQTIEIYFSYSSGVEKPKIKQGSAELVLCKGPEEGSVPGLTR